MNHHLSVRVSDELQKKLERCGLLLGVRYSDIVRRILIDNIDKEIEKIQKYVAVQ